MQFKTVKATDLCPQRSLPGAYAPLVRAIYDLPILSTEQFLDHGEAIQIPDWAVTPTLRVLVSHARAAFPNERFLLSIFWDEVTNKRFAWRRRDN